jgi:uncharacterized hydantoinase/oxoprolinase family protein
MTEIIAQQPVAVLSVLLIFGGGALWGIIEVIASNWRRAVTMQAELALKQAMVEHGYTPDDIVRVVAAGRAKTSEKPAGHESTPAAGS